jgi:RND superfamily putative drug exporter
VQKKLAAGMGRWSAEHRKLAIGGWIAFVSLSFDFKEMGVGLAVAILIDATIVRAVLLPATMKLLGRWNWYLPSKLGWLPHVSHEPAIELARA